MVPLLSVALLSMATVAPAPVQAQATATATMIQPYDAQVLTGTTVSLVWTPVVGATGYYLYIGHTAGAKDVVDSGQLSANTAGYTLPAGTYYVRLWTKVNGTWVYAKDTTFTLGAQTVLSSPTNGSTITATNPTLTWASVADAAKYYVYVGTSVGAKDVVNSGELTSATTSYPTTGLPTDKVLYVRLFTNVNGTWLGSDSTFTIQPNGTASPYAMYASGFQVYASQDAAGAFVHSTQGGDLFAGVGGKFVLSYAADQSNITYFGRYVFKGQTTGSATSSADYLYVSVRAPGSAGASSRVTQNISAAGNLLIRMGNEVTPSSPNGQANVFQVTMDNNDNTGANATSTCTTLVTLANVGTATAYDGMNEYKVPLTAGTWTCTGSVGTLADLKSTGVSTVGIVILGNKNTLVSGGLEAVDVGYISFTN